MWEVISQFLTIDEYQEHGTRNRLALQTDKHRLNLN